MLLSVRPTSFYFDKQKLKLVSIQNIKSELEENEIESYQRLIRILSHEISNSVSPINLVTTSLIKIIEKKVEADSTINLSQDEKDSFITGLKAMRKRSSGLSGFGEKFQNHTQLPKPSFTTFTVKDFIDVDILLKQNEIDENKISVSINIELADLMITADREMLDQVVLNFL